MSDVIITGAGRGIGRALAIALDKRFRQVVVARTAVAAGDVVREAARRGKSAEAVVGDLATLASARALGERLCGTIRPGATLVHNAGIWPLTRTTNQDGYESAFAVNTLGALAMQAPLIARGMIKRILVVGTGMMVKGRFDAERTPVGDDFSSLKTYCATKLALAVTMQDVAADHPAIDIAVVDPGVVKTGLGARSGFLGWLMGRLENRFETPEVAGERLARVLARDRWSAPGEASWFLHDDTRPWPTISEANRSEVRRAIAAALRRPEPPRRELESTVRAGTTAWLPRNDSTLN